MQKLSYLKSAVFMLFVLSTFSSQVLAAQLSGTYTIDSSSAASSTNFKNFASFFTYLTSTGVRSDGGVANSGTVGVSGPVVAMVAPGTYNEQLTITNTSAIPDYSAINNITFIGTDTANTILTHDASVQRPTLYLNAARNLIFRNIKIRSTGSSAGNAVTLVNASDSNRFIGCAFEVPYTSSTNFTVFAIAGNSSTTQVTAGYNAGNYNTIDSSSFRGGNYGLNMMGVSTAAPSIYNTVKHSNFKGQYSYGIYVYNQRQDSILRNSITDFSNPYNTFSIYGLYVQGNRGGCIVDGNMFVGGKGNGMAVYFTDMIGADTAHNIIANNMISWNGSYTAYLGWTAYTDFVHNTIVNTWTGGGNYNNFYLLGGVTDLATYHDLRCANNIFYSETGASLFYIYDTNSLAKYMSLFDYNCFWSNATYWFFSVIPAQGLGHVAGSIAYWKQRFPSFDHNTHSFEDKTRFPNSPYDLRSINFSLNNTGYPINTISHDVDLNPRSLFAPDIGVMEFDPIPNDVSAEALLQPSLPFIEGLNDVIVIIRNMGSSDLTSAKVHYQVTGDPTIYSKDWSGTLVSGARDTVKFTATSGPSSSSQQFDFAVGAVSMKAYTSEPNGVADETLYNDTIYLNGCTAISGTYTIDPLGSGSNNFTTIASAINRLMCGGISDNVVFNIASGTYDGKLTIGNIPGTSLTKKVVFQSATGNVTDVKIRSSNSTAGLAGNFTLNIFTASYIEFRNIILENAHTSYSRVVTFTRDNNKNRASTGVTFRNCIFNSPAVSTTSLENAIIYSDPNTIMDNLVVKNCVFNNGAYGIYSTGISVINKYTPNTVVDSCTFNGQYYQAIALFSHMGAKVRYNTINGTSSYTNFYGLYTYQTGGEWEVSSNKITVANGGYGMQFNRHVYYLNDLPAFATVTNNSITMSANTTAEYGIYFSNCSYLDIKNNSVRLKTTTSSSRALNFDGVATGPNNRQTTSIRTSNNMLYANGGYALFVNDVYADSALLEENDYNLYYSTTSGFAYRNGANYSSMKAFRGGVYAKRDLNSVNANVAFVGNTPKPDATSPLAWNVNGRGSFVYFQANKDVEGNARSIMASTGASDIGAYEILPTSTPNAATVTGTPSNGGTQYVLDNGDTIATVIWGGLGTVPTSVAARYYAGSLVSDADRFKVDFESNGDVATKLDAHVELDMTGGEFYSYDIIYRYKTPLLGTITDEGTMIGASWDAVNGWIYHVAPNMTLDTDKKTIRINGCPTGGKFTGTNDDNPLPVNLASIVVQKAGLDALLTWTTASEINSLRFEVERSINGSNFEKIDEVKAQGNSNRLHAYSFTDRGVGRIANNSTVYYRLKNVDRDASFDYSKTVSVTFNASVVRNTLVYPNPFNTDVHINFNIDKAQTVSLIVVDMFGKVITTQSNEVVAGDNTIDVKGLEQLPTGMYFVKMITEAGEEVSRIIKQ